MESSRVNFIDCDGIKIAASVETDSYDEHPIYYPANFLMYVERGQLNLHVDDKEYTIREKEFGLVRKYTHGKYVKTWQQNQKGFREHIFVLHDTFIKDVIREFDMPEGYMPCTLPMINLPHTPLLEGLMNSIEAYVTGQAPIDKQLILLKTREALHALTSLKPELIHIFNEFSDPARANLVNFIEHNYTQNLSLEQFAELSGRSLSTFNRDFRKEFNISPHKWIKERRLELAKRLLLQTPKKASDVYFEVGFEDLAHFSKSFKSYFGQNPSDMKSAAMA
jgi:AraC-like DNA-binding protein